MPFFSKKPVLRHGFLFNSLCNLITVWTEGVTLCADVSGQAAIAKPIPKELKDAIIKTNVDCLSGAPASV